MVQEDVHRDDRMDDEMRGRSESRSHDDSSDDTQHPHDLASPPPHLPALTIQRPSNGEQPAGRPIPVGRSSALGHGGDGGRHNGAFSPSWDFSRSTNGGAGGGGSHPNEPSPSQRSRSPGAPHSGRSTSPGDGGSRANSPRRLDAASSSGSGMSFPPSSSFPFAHGSATDPTGAQGMMAAPPLSRTPNHLSSGAGGPAYGDPSSSGRVSPGARGGPLGLGPQHAQDGDEERDRFPPRQLPQFDFNQRRHSLANGEASYQSYSPNPHLQQGRPLPPPSMTDPTAGAGGPPSGAWAAQAALKRKMSHDRAMQPYPDPHYIDSNGGLQQGGTVSPTSAGGQQAFTPSGPLDPAMEGGPTKRRGSAFDSKMTSLSLSERMSAQGSPFWADGRRDSVASIRSNASYQSSTGYGTGTSTQTSYTAGSELGGGPKSYTGGWQPQPGQSHPAMSSQMPSGLPQPAPPGPPAGSGYYAQGSHQPPPPQHYGPPSGHGSYPPPPPHSTAFPPHPPPHHTQHRPGPPPMHGHPLDNHPSAQFENYSMGGGQPAHPVPSSSASTVAAEHAPSRSQSPHSSSGSPRASISAIDQQPQRVAVTKTESDDARSRGGSFSTERKAKGGLLAPPEGETPYSRSPELRVSHKLAERKRRKEMKELFDELRDQLPAERGTKSSKWEILSKAVDHITALKEATLAKDREIERLRRDLDAMRYPSSSYAPGHAAPPPPGPMPPPPTAYSHPYPHGHIHASGRPQAPSGPPPVPHEHSPPLQQQPHPSNGPYAMPHRPIHQQHHSSQSQQGMPPPAGYSMSQAPPQSGGYHPGPPPHSMSGPRESLPPLQQGRGAYAPHPNSRQLAQENPHHAQ